MPATASTKRGLPVTSSHFGDCSWGPPSHHPTSSSSSAGTLRSMKFRTTSRGLVNGCPVPGSTPFSWSAASSANSCFTRSAFWSLTLPSSIR